MFDFKKEVELIKDDLLRDIETLVNIPSVYDEGSIKPKSPYGANCRIALDKMLEFGQRDGFEVKDVDGYAGHINIGATDKQFGILGHLDVVPVNTNGWDTDPFKMERKDNYIYGRGTSDDKGPLLAGYYAAKIINKLDFEKKMGIRVIFGCDEERGSSCLEYYFKKEPNCVMGFTPDAEFPVVYGEKGIVHCTLTGDFEKDGLIALYAGSRPNIVPESCEAIVEGNYHDYENSFNDYLKKNQLEGSIEEEGNHTKLILKGKSAHASIPEFGINAVARMCEYLKTITDNKLVKLVNTYLSDIHGKQLDLAKDGPKGNLTMNLGIIKYIKGNASITLDIRYPASLTFVAIKEKLELISNKSPVTLTYHNETPLFVDPESELIKGLHSAYQQVTGSKEEPQIIGGGTYAKKMPNCVAFGACKIDEDTRMHGNNEFMNIDTLLEACEIYCQALYNIIKK